MYFHDEDSPMTWAAEIASGSVVTDKEYSDRRRMTADELEWVAEFLELRVKHMRKTEKSEKVGRWMVDGELLACSVCGKEWAAFNEGLIRSFNYCPHCGADMKGANDG